MAIITKLNYPSLTKIANITASDKANEVKHKIWKAWKRSYEERKSPCWQFNNIIDRYAARDTTFPIICEEIDNLYLMEHAFEVFCNPLVKTPTEFTIGLPGEDFRMWYTWSHLWWESFRCAKQEDGRINKDIYKYIYSVLDIVYRCNSSLLKKFTELPIQEDTTVNPIEELELENYDHITLKDIKKSKQLQHLDNCLTKFIGKPSFLSTLPYRYNLWLQCLTWEDAFETYSNVIQKTFKQ